jgi:hypothetical protein
MENRIRNGAPVNRCDGSAFLVPDVGSAHGVIDDLRVSGISDANLYVVAREGTPLGDLPDAGDIAKSDFYPQLERGLAMGRTIGVIGGCAHRACQQDAGVPLDLCEDAVFVHGCRPWSTERYPCFS